MLYGMIIRRKLKIYTEIIPYLSRDSEYLLYVLEINIS